MPTASNGWAWNPGEETPCSDSTIWLFGTVLFDTRGIELDYDALAFGLVDSFRFVRLGFGAERVRV
jgi:hypothetical protein